MLGARISDIVVLLAAQFTKPVRLANVVACPIAWYGINVWLQGFAYRMEINWLIFPLGGLVIFAVSMITIATQSARAASMNPVLALRYE